MARRARGGLILFWRRVIYAETPFQIYSQRLQSDGRAPTVDILFVLDRVQLHALGRLIEPKLGAVNLFLTLAGQNSIFQHRQIGPSGFFLSDGVFDQREIFLLVIEFGVLNYQKRHAARLFAEDALFRPAMLLDDLVQPLPVLAVEVVLSLDSLLPLL